MSDGATRTGGAGSTAAAAVLVVEAGLAALGVWIHYGFTAEYGDITQSAVEGWRSAFSSGVAGAALGLVAVAALLALSVSRQRWARLAAVAIPLLMAGGLLAVTPAALQEKLVTQYDDTPQCVAADPVAAGPGSGESQRAFESIEHVGHFGGGGESGVGGCDRQLLLTEDVDVLQHYRAALPEAGWQVVDDDLRGLRAERDGVAFEVVACDRGGVVWAGTADLSGRARCPTVY